MGVYLVSLQQLASIRARRASPEVVRTQSVEELLNLPKSQLGALLAECGEPRSKVLLALIYRLAVIEAQLADLGAGVHGRGAPPPKPGSTDVVHKVVGDTGKSDLLEQVFRKNLLLRRMD